MRIRYEQENLLIAKISLIIIKHCTYLKDFENCIENRFILSDTSVDMYQGFGLSVKG